MAGRYVLVETAGITNAGWTQVYTGNVKNQEVIFNNPQSTIDCLLRISDGDPGGGVTTGFQLRRSSDLPLRIAPSVNVWARAEAAGPMRVEALVISGPTAADLTS